MKKLKMYKVLNADLRSPFQGFQYEIGKEYVCEDFDESDEECSEGFYATTVEGIVYSYRKGRRVFEVEMGGREKRFDQFKHRFEKQTIIREIPEVELKKLLEEESQRVGYNLLEACFPIHPFEIEPVEVTRVDIDNLKRWASVWSSVRDSVGNSVGDSVRDSVGNSVGDSVRDSVGSSVWSSVGSSVWASVWASVWSSVGSSVGDSVGDSVRASVWASVWASVGAYISSLFPNIKKWVHIEHEEGVNPFQCCIDLWKRGLVPSFDDTTWRLHSKNGIVYEMKKEN